MPTEIELRAWSTAVRAPVALLIVTALLVIALAMALGATPAPMYADPYSPSVM